MNKKDAVTKVKYIDNFVTQENTANKLRGLIGAFSERGDTASKLSLIVNPIDQPRIDENNNMYVGILENLLGLIDFDDDDIDLILSSLFKGFMFHELSHYDYTEFKPFMDFIKNENGKFKKLRQQIFNILEDGRIERKKEETSKITGKYFDLLNFLILDLQSEGNSDRKLTDIDYYFKSVLPVTKLGMYPKDYDTYPDKVKDAIDESLQYIESAVTATTTKAVQKPAEEIVRIAKSLMTQEQQQQSENQEGEPMEVQSDDSGQANPSGDPSEQSQDGDSQNSSSSSSSNNENKSENKKENNSGSGDEKNKEKKKEEKEGGSTKKPSQYDEKKKQKIQEALKSKERAEKMKERRKLDGQREGTSLSNKEITEIEKIYSGEKYRVQKIDYQRFQSLPQELKLRGKKLRKEIEKILKTKQKEVLTGQKRGVLNPNDLHKLAGCNTDVFRKTLSPQRMENVVYILRDGSGSMMCGDKIRNSTNTAAILKEALKGLVPFKDVIFNTHGRDIAHYVISDFDEKNRKDNHAFSSSSLFGGTNKDGFSLKIAISEILQRREESKILFVLSDGLPSDYRSEEDAITDVKERVKEAKKKGVKVISIFFGSERERNQLKGKYERMYGADSVVCVDPSQIEKSAVALLKRILKNT